MAMSPFTNEPRTRHGNVTATQSQAAWMPPACALASSHGVPVLSLEHARQMWNDPVSNVFYNQGVILPYNSQGPAGRAAGIFQRTFQAAALAAPGSVLATRADLGLQACDVVVVDIGGEGQKSDKQGAQVLQSGSVHAINVNTQCTISSVPLQIVMEPGAHAVRAEEGSAIPNLVRPATDWPSPSYQGRLIPFADKFSDLTLMEGAPVHDYHVRELARTTSRFGWIVLAVDYHHFKDRLQALADLHNGRRSACGRLWEFPSGTQGFPRVVIPPAWASEALRPLFAMDRVDAHDVPTLVTHLTKASPTTRPLWSLAL